MKYHVYTFEETRHTHEVEAETTQEALQLVLQDPEKWRTGFSEPTGVMSDDVCVDPLLPDGNVDFENSEWFKCEEDKGELK